MNFVVGVDPIWKVGHFGYLYPLLNLALSVQPYLQLKAQNAVTDHPVMVSSVTVPLIGNESLRVTHPVMYTYGDDMVFRHSLFVRTERKSLWMLHHPRMMASAAIRKVDETYRLMGPPLEFVKCRGRSYAVRMNEVSDELDRCFQYSRVVGLSLLLPPGRQVYDPARRVGRLMQRHAMWNALWKNPHLSRFSGVVLGVVPAV